MHFTTDDQAFGMPSEAFFDRAYELFGQVNTRLDATIDQLHAATSDPVYANRGESKHLDGKLKQLNQLRDEIGAVIASQCVVPDRPV